MCEEAKATIFAANEMTDKTRERVHKSAKEKNVQESERDERRGLRLSKLSTARHEWITEILKDQLRPERTDLLPEAGFSPSYSSLFLPSFRPWAIQYQVYL